MWLATKLGFYSIVQKAEDEYHVRARLKRDLTNLRKAAELGEIAIERWPGADYRYRFIVHQADLAQVFAALMQEIDYPNFKSEIARRQDQRPKLEAYHRIWATMAALQQ